MLKENITKDFEKKENDESLSNLKTSIVIYLNDKDWKNFTEELETPSKPNESLIELMQKKMAWEK